VIAKLGVSRLAELRRFVGPSSSRGYNPRVTTNHRRRDADALKHIRVGQPSASPPVPVPRVSDIFSSTVRERPAVVPPLSMSVNKDRWADRRNRLPPRYLTRHKDADLTKQITSLESLGVVERSTAAEYSQVHLVRKPDNS
jgi:hypothetical protein